MYVCLELRGRYTKLIPYDEKYLDYLYAQLTTKDIEGFEACELKQKSDLYKFMNNSNINIKVFIKNMSNEKDSIVGRFIYARLKQGRKVRYGVLLEYKDSKEIIKISKTEYEIISDFDLSRHPLLNDFHRKISLHYKYYRMKEYLIDDKFEEVLEAEALKVFDDYNID